MTQSVYSLFVKIFPGQKDTDFTEVTGLAPKTPDDQIIQFDSLQGLDGRWAFQFKNNILEWFTFNAYIKEVNQGNFLKCLAVYDKVEEDFAKWFGEAKRIIEGEQRFMDPLREVHWGYDVMRSWFENDVFRSKIEFKFMGSKGAYNFVVAIETHRKEDKLFKIY